MSYLLLTLGVLIVPCLMIAYGMHTTRKLRETTRIVKSKGIPKVLHYGLVVLQATEIARVLSHAEVLHIVAAVLIAFILVAARSGVHGDM